MVLCQKNDDFSLIALVFTSEGRMERAIDRQNGAAATVMWLLHWSIMEKEMS